MNQKGFVNIVSIVLLLGLVGIAGYFTLVKKQEPVAQQTTPSTTTQTPTPTTQTKTPIANSLPKFLFQETGGGCGNIFVHKINSDDTMGISVSARQDKLGLSTQEKTFKIGNTDGLNVEILTGHNIAQLYCYDVVYPNQPKPKKLIAKSGNAIIKISNFDKSLPEWNRNYKATVILKDVHFFDQNDNDVGMVDDLVFKDIAVGWLPG